MRKILFLDVDGVLNNTNFLSKGENGCFDMDPQNCKVLADLLKQIPEIEIVVSSCWRLGKTVFELKQLFEGQGIPQRNIIDKTGRGPVGCKRGFEIQEWLIKNVKESASVVIVDDDSDMEPLKHHLMQVDRKVGLITDYAERIAYYFINNYRSLWKQPQPSPNSKLS